MAKSRTGGSVKSKMVTLIYGAPFSGKTTMAMQLAYFKREDGKPFRVLVIDGENGGVDETIDKLIENGVQENNIFVVYTQSLQEAEAIIQKIKTHEPFYHYDDVTGEETEEIVLDADGEPFYPDALVVDGTSVFKMTSEQGLLELSKKRNTVKANKNGLTGAERTVAIQNADLEFKDYKKLNFLGQNLVLDLMACGVHVCLTAREKDETITREIDGKKESINTGKKVYDSFKGIDYNIKTQIHMINQDGTICAEIIKDRTEVHKRDEIIEDPTLLDWQVIIKNNSNKREFVLNNDLNNAVQTEYKMYEKESEKSFEDVVEKAEEPEPVENTSEIDSIKEEINNIMKSFNPVKKNRIVEELRNNKLPSKPTEIKTAKDIETLKKVLDIIKEK